MKREKKKLRSLFFLSLQFENKVEISRSKLKLRVKVDTKVLSFSHLALERPVSTVLPQHGQVGDQPPRETEGVLAVGGEPAEGLLRRLP